MKAGALTSDHGQQAFRQIQDHTRVFSGHLPYITLDSSSSTTRGRGPGKAAIIDAIQMYGAVPGSRFAEGHSVVRGGICEPVREHIRGGEAVLFWWAALRLEGSEVGCREETNRGKKMPQLVKVKRI